MSQPPATSLPRAFVRFLVLPASTFLLIPLLALGFARYGAHRIDAEILQSVETDRRLTAERRDAARALVAAHPPTAACGDPDPSLDAYRGAVCSTWSAPWNFHVAGRVAWWATLLGVGALVGVGLLGLVAFASRAAQYWSFMIGWRGLLAATAIETVLQGALATWLSYWGTALLFDQYSIKLIVLVGIAAAVAVLVIVLALFGKVPPPDALEAVRVTTRDAPGLWRRVSDLAARLGARPPVVIAAGVDDNFFVTEQRLPLEDGTPGAGRLLYVSLPLLRTLSPSEADAVLAHELAHFGGGDTAASARLYPAIARYERYCADLAEAGVTLPAAHVMRLYRAIFELALQREQRRRELRADAAAARVTSPDDLGRALVKATGYSSFRAQTEGELFSEHDVLQGDLGLAARIDAGLAAHVASPGFLDHVRTRRVPHPFDSHPPLEARLAAVGAAVRVEDAAELLGRRPARTWADDVLTAGAIEAKLWGAYEERFKAEHEASLAWRYLPADDTERAHVLSHFPDVAFRRRDGGAITITHVGVTQAGGASVAFADIAEVKLNSGALVEKLVISRRRGPKVEVDLRPLGKEAKRFKETFDLYWRRDQIARGAAQAA